MKTFKDLIFKEHYLSKSAKDFPSPLKEQCLNAKQAVMDFPNGYGISVLLGECFYSNGVDTYEIGVIKDGALCYDVIGYLSEDEVSKVMKKIQEL
jgi:hypothetical protein